MMIGTITILITLWSTMPIPVSSTVTTQQIVSTMKRGENGVSSVSQVLPIRLSPRRCFAAVYIIRLRCYGKMAGGVTGMRWLSQCSEAFPGRGAARSSCGAVRRRAGAVAKIELGMVPALRSSVKNAAARPGHETSPLHERLFDDEMAGLAG